MADFVLKDGREITFDLDAISIREFRAMLKPEQSDEDEYAGLAKVSGLTIEEVGNMPMHEYRRFANAFVKRASQPLADPN